jgi:F plasmid transfer operon, TraF, protein
MRLARRSVPFLAFVATVVALVPSRPSSAQQPFAVFGARQVALGGASMALGDDPAGFVNNPALTDPTVPSYALSYGVVATGAGNFVPLLKGVSGNDPVELASPSSPNAAGVRANLASLAAGGVGALGDRQVGIATTLDGWGVAVSRSGWSASFARPDLVHVQTGADPGTSFLYNDSRVAFRALTLEDYAVSRSVSLFENVLVVGVAGHYLRGTAGIKEESAFKTDVARLDDFVRRGSNGGIDRTRSRFSWDAGALVTIGIFRIGGVMKGINRPQFPFDDQSSPADDRGKTAALGRQTRVGASVRIPGTGLTIAADLDLSKNGTLIDTLASRTVGGGVEWLFGALGVRGGVSVNLEAPDRPTVASAGVAWSSGKVRIDLSAVYRSNDGAIGGVASARIGL